MERGERNAEKIKSIGERGKEFWEPVSCKFTTRAARER
jgi:hypothetical protein